MKALILAAGYATRLYPLTLNKPKPLLKVGSKTITDRLVDKIERIEPIDEIYIVTNQKFSSNFEEWAKGRSSSKRIRVINDRTLSNETRLGGIGDMNMVVEEAKIEDDLLVLGGDNLFSFDLSGFIRFGRSKAASAVALRDVEDSSEAKKYGIVSLDENDRVTEFVEKPEKPKSTLAAMCVYYFPKEKLRFLDAYLKAGENKDAPGLYISWLAKKDVVYGYKIEGEWFDIGDKRLLKLADELYKERERKEEHD